MICIPHHRSVGLFFWTLETKPGFITVLRWRSFSCKDTKTSHLLHSRVVLHSIFLTSNLALGKKTKSHKMHECMLMNVIKHCVAFNYNVMQILTVQKKYRTKILQSHSFQRIWLVQVPYSLLYYQYIRKRVVCINYQWISNNCITKIIDRILLWRVPRPWAY